MNAWEENWDAPEEAAPKSAFIGTLSLLTIMAAGFVLSGILFQSLKLDPEAVLRRAELWRLLTYGFVFEATEFALIGFLGFSILFYFFSREVERRIGTLRLVSAFALCQLFGAVAHVAAQAALRTHDPVAGNAMPGIGAIIALAALQSPSPSARIFFFIPMKLRLAAIFTLALAFLFIVAQSRGAEPAMPLAAALVAALAFSRLRSLFDLLARRRLERASRRQAEQEEENRRSVDAILEKIHQSGLQSLSREELKLLKRASRDLAEHRSSRSEE